MLISILINVQYLQNVAFSFEKDSSDQNHSLSDSHHPIEQSPQADFPPHYPLPLFEKPWTKPQVCLKFVCLVQVKFDFSIDNICFRVVS